MFRQAFTGRRVLTGVLGAFVATALLISGMVSSSLAVAGATAQAPAAQQAAAAAPVATITYHQRRCDRDTVVLGLRNDLASAYTYQLRLYNSTTGITQYRTLSVGAGATAYFYTYGVKGAYTGYFYRYVSGAYSYTGVYATGTNTCAVAATLQRSGRYARVMVKNNGTAYAGVYSRKLAPAPVVNHYNYIAPAVTAYTPWTYVGVAGTNFAFAEDILGGTVFVSPPYLTGVS